MPLLAILCILMVIAGGTMVAQALALRVRGRYFALYIACLVVALALLAPLIVVDDYGPFWPLLAASAGIAAYVGWWLNWPVLSRMWRRGENDGPWDW